MDETTLSRTAPVDGRSDGSAGTLDPASPLAAPTTEPEKPLCSDAPSPEVAASRRRLLSAAGATMAGGMLLTRRAGAATPTAPWDVRPLRTPGPSAATTKGGDTLPSTPSAAIVTLNRLAFGPRPGDVTAFNGLGANDTQRLAAWVAQQLNPTSIDDSDLEARIAQAGFAVYDSTNNPNTLLARLWDWYENDNEPNGNTSSNIPRDEAIRAKLLRAIYSRRQLVEVLADYWHDHFNVHIENSSRVRTTFLHLDLVIRQNQLGRFRDLLEAVTRSSAMLYYLDNYTSSNSGPNENFCRELFELHTLGAENYLGIIQQNQVPTENGVPIGYVDADVFEATRCFTGWSFSYGVSGDGDTGLFLYRPEWHDRFQKNVLGQFIPQDQPDLKDGHDVLDALASHPGTGRFVARRLCRRFVSDTPSEALVQTVASVFTAQWQAPDQLKQVYEAIFLSDEFRTTWAEKIKRPFEHAVSALRASGSTFSPKMDDGDTQDFLWRFDDTGHEPFHWPAPDGFPDTRNAWQSMSPMVMSWRLAGWLADFDDDQDNLFIDVVAQTPGSVRTPNELADFWIDQILNRPMTLADRQEVVDFIAQGTNPDFDLNLQNSSTASRLRSMVALILMSPDFFWR